MPYPRRPAPGQSQAGFDAMMARLFGCRPKSPNPVHQHIPERPFENSLDDEWNVLPPEVIAANMKAAAEWDVEWGEKYLQNLERIAVLEARIRVQTRQLVRSIGVVVALLAAAAKAQLWAVSL